MFLYTQSSREKVITAGALLSCGTLVCIAGRVACFGGYGLIVALALILVPVALWKGWRVGYFGARFILGGTAIICAINLVNPMAWADLIIGNSYTNYERFLCLTLVMAIFTGFLSYCVGQHAKLRGLKLL